MKKYLTALALAAGMVSVAGCGDDFLTEVPQDFVSPDQFYQNAGDAVAAVNAAYASFVNLQSPLGSSDYVGRNFWMLTEYPTEVATSRLSAANERSLIGNYHPQFSSSHPYLETVWQAAYAGINRANTVIARVPAVEMDATRRAQIVGEAKFLRALHYYWLAGLFGGVPLKLEPTGTLGEIEAAGPLARATAQQTWAQITKDLTEAAAVLPNSWSGNDYGRATKGAALALMGKAYLQSAATTGATEDYAKAVTAFKSVVALGYKLDPNYASLFDGTNEKSTEIIFALQNIRRDGYGGTLTEWFSPITNPQIFRGGAQNQVQAERPFYDSYATNDVRKAATWLTTFTNAGRTVTWTWTTNSITTAANYGSTGPAPRKYLDLAAADGGMEEPDYIILREADVLLSLAEAVNATTGPNAEAYGYVDEVRARAGVGKLTPGLSQAAFRDSVFLNRRFELALEMHGVFDNRRNWTWAKSRVEANMVGISTANRSPFTSSVEKFDSRPIAEKWRLYPIPARACELNEMLTQNPGWSDGICK